MHVHLLFVVAGVAVLYAGGEVLVRYATRLARALHVNPLIIGLTVIAFGTSAPELAAAISAALRDAPDIAVGNVIGSNIANVGLILGLTVIFAPMVAERRFVGREVPFMILTGALLLPFVWLGSLGRWQALVLLVLLAVFLRAMFRRGDVPSETGEEPRSPAGIAAAAIGTAVGLALLSAGAELTVSAAQELARAFGVSERVIGLTVVAFGTSVPELASCIVAARRKETGLVLGNIVGSNIFNTLLILPTAMLIEPIRVSWTGFGTDVVVMVGFSVLLLLFFIGGRALHRLEGGLLTVLYLGYIAYLAVQNS